MSVGAFAIDLETPVVGRSVTLASATLREGDRVVHKVSAALSGREGWPTRQFARMPDVAAPEDCEVKPPGDFDQSDNLLGVFQKRLAYQNDETGTEHLWLGTVKNLPMSAGLLAIIATVAWPHRRLLVLQVFGLLEEPPPLSEPSP